MNKEEQKLKKILEKFSITYDEAIAFDITYDDLTGITELVPNKKYQIRLSIGSRSVKIVNCKLIQAINIKKAMIKEEQYNIENNIPKKPKLNKDATLNDAINGFANYYLELAKTREKLDPNTVYWYYSILRRYLIPFFGADTKMHKLTEKSFTDLLLHINTIISNRTHKLLSATTIKHAHVAIGVFLKYCYNKSKPRLIDSNYAKKINFGEFVPYRSKKRKSKKTHPIEEIIRIRETVKKYGNIRLICCFFVISDLGCRREECVGLRWRHIDINSGAVDYAKAITNTIPKSFSEEFGGKREKDLKTENSYRLNYLSKTTRKYLKQYKQFIEAQGYIVDKDDFIIKDWDNLTGLSSQQLYRDFINFYGKFNLLNIPPHDYRHSLTNALLEAGFSKKDVANYMGDTERTIDDHYSNINNKVEKEIGNYIDNLLNNNVAKININLNIITAILNNKFNDSQKIEIYNVLDFITDKKNNVDTIDNSLKLVKDYLISKLPQLACLCDNNSERLQLKLDTLSAFGINTLDVVQDIKHFEKIKEYSHNIKI